jgi:hypothetical protein
MTFRTSSIALAAVAGLALAGCGSDDSGTVKPVSTGATAPRSATGAAPQTSAPTSPTNVQGTAPPAGGSNDTGATPSEQIRVPATFIFTRPNRVDPPTVTIPPFVRVELTLASRDGRPHTLVLRAGGHTYTLRVAAGRRAVTSIPGLKAGTYPLTAVAGGPSAKLIVGGQVGP